MFSSEDRRTIQCYADGRPSMREAALAIFHSELRANGVAMRGDPFFEFMSEVDSPAPDYGLRARYRDEVIRSKVD